MSEGGGNAMADIMPPNAERVVAARDLLRRAEDRGVLNRLRAFAGESERQTAAGAHDAMMKRAESGWPSRNGLDIGTQEVLARAAERAPVLRAMDEAAAADRAKVAAISDASRGLPTSLPRDAGQKFLPFRHQVPVDKIMGETIPSALREARIYPGDVHVRPEAFQSVVNAVQRTHPDVPRPYLEGLVRKAMRSIKP